jgi:hypothetical protein
MAYHALMSTNDWKEAQQVRMLLCLTTVPQCAHHLLTVA